MRQPRVLLIPGIAGSPDLLVAAAAQLFPGMRILPFDHRDDLAPDDIEGLADRALALLDADGSGDEPALVCGESFGGAVALTLARRYPERVRGLVLFSTFGRYSGLCARQAKLGLFIWRLLGDRVAGLVIRLSRPLRVPGALGFRFSRQVLWAFLRHDDGHPPAYRGKCLATLRFDATPWLGSITCPTLVFTGSWDPIVPPTAGAELARLIPNARLHRLPGGHLAHFVRAAEVGQLISRWAEESAATADVLEVGPRRPCYTSTAPLRPARAT